MGSIISELKNGVKTFSAEETAALAVRFAADLPRDAFVGLIGDLGAGKTTFTRALAEALGIKKRVKSPSFNVCLLYDIPDGRIFAHVDAYRLESAEQFDSLLLDEVAPSPRVLCVEWADRIPDAIPEGAFILRFSSDENFRSITLE